MTVTTTTNVFNLGNGTEACFRVTAGDRECVLSLAALRGASDSVLGAALAALVETVCPSLPLPEIPQ